MVICSECGTRITPKTSSCPNCGSPVDATGVGPPVRARRRVPLLAIVAVLVFALAGVGAYLLSR